ncbi:glycosyltransferase [Flavobacterium algicola]|uniref:glycosyltransferase n=1 Tax=Flavobacterium algicola TaxID=556529 RepID=UPI001EFD1E6B|nr:glycosyltransferase [Flavobacterium algicola]MCG9792217.1 glycosyltransferase [Flavobacterium algicola]
MESDIENENKTILITVLNWGLGHATRCIPIIKLLHYYNFTPIIASDGQALQLLQKEFPYVHCLELPSTTIRYPKNPNHFKRNLIKNLPKIALTIRDEQKLVDKWINKYEIIGIISDNRMGCYSTKVPSVYLTHQVNVLTGTTTWLSTIMHQYFIKKFTSCWVPDHNSSPNLGGVLSHLSKKNNLNLVYIGTHSRLHLLKTEIKYDLMVLLSGPEPQRELLEKHLIDELQKYHGNVIFVKGVVENLQKKEQIGQITFFNFMKTRQLEQLMQESELILCRSGYTTIMDLAKLNKKAFFIPTPGQYEQIYLAEKFNKEGLAPYSSQENFTISKLDEVKNYKGLSQSNENVDWEAVLKIFK